MAKNVRGKQLIKLICKCGGEIKMKTLGVRGKIKHFAECQGCGKKSRKPKGLMN